MYEYKAKVNRIVDGDTIDVTIDLGFDIHHSCRVRLYGINAPESRTRDLEEKERGLAAKERLKELLKSGECIIETEYDNKGKFGRVLGVIFPINQDQKINISVQQTLLAEGHAVEYFGGKR